MTRKALLMASLLVALAYFGAAYLFVSELPAVPAGPNGPGHVIPGKWIMLLMPPAVIILFALFYYALPSIEPRKEGLDRSQGLYFTSWAAVLFFGMVVVSSFLAMALHWRFPHYQLVYGSLGMAVALMGNQYGKSRSMYLVGIRTPWTLASEEVWIKTHRLGGKLLTLYGLVVVAVALFVRPYALPSGLLPGGLIAILLVLYVYSYLLWRSEVPPGGSS